MKKIKFNYLSLAFLLNSALILGCAGDAEFKLPANMSNTLNGSVDTSGNDLIDPVGPPPANPQGDSVTSYIRSNQTGLSNCRNNGISLLRGNYLSSVNSAAQPKNIFLSQDLWMNAYVYFINDRFVLNLILEQNCNCSQAKTKTFSIQGRLVPDQASDQVLMIDQNNQAVAKLFSMRNQNNASIQPRHQSFRITLNQSIITNLNRSLARPIAFSTLGSTQYQIRPFHSQIPQSGKTMACQNLESYLTTQEKR